MVMGTPAYMSPEQVAGRPLDHRSDIFSFGVVLHEMATGRRPFEGSSSAELISSILRDTPPSVTDARPDLPSDLARVIHHCLEKDPAQRYPSTRILASELRAVAKALGENAEAHGHMENVVHVEHPAVAQGTATTPRSVSPPITSNWPQPATRQKYPVLCHGRWRQAGLRIGWHGISSGQGSQLAQSSGLRMGQPTLETLAR